MLILINKFKYRVKKKGGGGGGNNNNAIRWKNTTEVKSSTSQAIGEFQKRKIPYKISYFL